MEIVLIKRETTGNSPNFVHENVNITKFEIMDGAPVKGKDRTIIAPNLYKVLCSIYV